MEAPATQELINSGSLCYLSQKLLSEILFFLSTIDAFKLICKKE